MSTYQYWRENNSSEMKMNENELSGVNYCLNSLRISLKSVNKKRLQAKR